jgi:hypothetical protein
MRQGVTSQTPRAPQSPGNVIGEAVREIAAGAMAQARAEIRAQLDEAVAERAALEAHMNEARSNRARSDLRGEVRELDLRIEKLQDALGKIESKLTTTDGPRQTFTGTGFPTPFPLRAPVDPFNPAPMVIAVVGILFIGFPIALTIARLLWKRANNTPPAAVSAEQTRRFDRIEQSVDAIAIEVERISENQRYLTRLLAEPKKEGIGTGARS